MLSLGERAEFLVCGYIRMHEQTLFKQENDNLFHHIPYEIIDICVAFHGKNDSFSKAGPLLQIHENRNVVTAIFPGGVNSVFGSTGIDLGKINTMLYRWNIKILEFDEWFKMHIGLTTNTTIVNKRFTKYIKGPKTTRSFSPPQQIPGTEIFQVYSYISPDYNAENIEQQQPAPKEPKDISYVISNHYGDGFQEGDIIGLELNTRRHTIAYFINNKNQRVFTHIKEKEYYLGISFGGKDNCVQLVGFIESPIPDR